MKLNVGCGDKYLDGYVNIDLLPAEEIGKRNVTRHYRAPDIVADVRKIPLDDGCADEVLAVHVFEHFYLWEAVNEVLPEWRRLLKHGGLLALEMPDVVKAARNVVQWHEAGNMIDEMRDVQQIKQGVQMGMWGLYGDPRSEDVFMGHHWGWTFRTLRPRLKEIGFTNINEVPTRFHGTGRTRRDFRVEATKG